MTTNNNSPRCSPSKTKFQEGNGCGNDETNPDDIKSKSSDTETPHDSKVAYQTYSDGSVYHGQVYTPVDTRPAALFLGMQSLGEYKIRRNGFGELTWSDGSRYRGEFKDDLRHGKGTHFWTTGDVRMLKFTTKLNVNFCFNFS